MNHLASFIGAQPRLGLVTYHRYPLRACTTDSTQASFPTIPNLLADSSSSGLAAGVAPFAAVAHRHQLPLRMTEINSASCQGTAGVSDSFASALWALDTMFNMASAGVDGVNFHMLPGSHYELFSTSQASGGAWQAFVHPEYYGLYMFAQAFPPGARLLAVTAPSGPVKVWATQASDGAVRVTLINQDPTSDHTVQFQMPGSPALGFTGVAHRAEPGRHHRGHPGRADLRADHDHGRLPGRARRPPRCCPAGGSTPSTSRRPVPPCSALVPPPRRPRVRAAVRVQAAGSR